MRGADARQTSMFHFVSVEDRVPAQHPLRAVRTAAIAVLEQMAPKLDALYRGGGPAAVPPEQILRGLLLWALYGVPSERRFIEELDYNLLFRWFVGLGIEDEVWSRATFRRNRRRLHDAGVVARFLSTCLSRIPGRVLYNDHFNMSWSLIEEWCGQRRIDFADDGDDGDEAERSAEAEPEPDRRRATRAERGDDG